jgi:IS5 family transposase
MPPDAPRLAPAIARAITATGVVPNAVTADRGYGQASVDEALAELGVELVAIPRKGQPGKARQQIEANDSFVELVK